MFTGLDPAAARLGTSERGIPLNQTFSDISVRRAERTTGIEKSPWSPRKMSLRCRKSGTSTLYLIMDRARIVYVNAGYIWYRARITF